MDRNKEKRIEISYPLFNQNWLRLGWLGARNQELYLGFPCGWQELEPSQLPPRDGMSRK